LHKISTVVQLDLDSLSNASRSAETSNEEKEEKNTQ
tara:strand:- start:431 stop:538 length:108 start_codon:yes stop_codon:yes gene_type:complete